MNVSGGIRLTFLSRFRNAAIRDAWRGPRIIVRARRKCALAARGTAEASEAMVSRGSGQCAKGQKSQKSPTQGAQLASGGTVLAHGPFNSSVSNEPHAHRLIDSGER